LLADEADDELEEVGPVAVEVPELPVLTLVGVGVIRGWVVVVIGVAVVVVVVWVVEEVPVPEVPVPVVPVEDPPALLVRQLVVVPLPTVKGAVCEIAPVESRKVSPREVPAG